MSPIDMRELPTEAASTRANQHTGTRTAGLRLVRLHLTSRRVPSALAVLAGCAVVLQAALRWHWGSQGGSGLQRLVPLVIESTAAMVVTATTTSPFGESERTGGRWLPFLRLGTVTALCATAIAILLGGSADTLLTGGLLDVLRNVVGFVGIDLLCGAVLGGPLAWVGPLTYLALAEYALTENWTSPWTWPARPSHDLGGWLCAAAVCAAGLIVVTVRGARDSARE
jgi:hypothetical protein